jgi:hypothetical protein
MSGPDVTPSVGSNMPIPYSNATDVITVLNLQPYYNDPNKYLIWMVPTSINVINRFVTWANVRTTALFGDLTQSTQYGLAQQYATWLAVLNLMEMMSINWAISGWPVQVGDISINRLQGMIPALEAIKEQAQSELQKLYILLSQFSFPNNYQSPSPYIYMGGGGWVS